MKRVFLIVLDSFGIGEEPDANLFGDVGTNTLRSVSTSEFFRFENMAKLGFFNIDGVEVGKKCENPSGAFARMQESSMGKDTTIGHWEIGGIISPKPFPTYPNGFPKEILDEFEKRTGRGVICNCTTLVGRQGKSCRVSMRWDASLQDRTRAHPEITSVPRTGMIFP